MPRLTFPELTPGDAIALLESNCTDWSVHNRDWPRHGARYEVWAIHFFALGKGAGRTLGEAAQRAVAHMRRMDAKIPRATWEEMKAI
ncbi:MAG: hypothetical protein BWY85_00050 [Firmicutes bacterium ADurb.Bin506]|nr:MAG: hypothetical protein BWY85_00050 [Firmicutes bacterium ADurb.Bin506]